MDKEMAVNSSYYNLNYSNDYPGVLITECHLKSYHHITAASFITICCFSLLGNSLLFYILVRFEDIKRVTILFLLNLAIFDLLFTLTLPFWATDHLLHWIFGDTACKILTGAYFVGIYGSLILLTVMTVDRFFAIVVRSQWLTRRRRLKSARAACAGAWLISGGACLKESLFSEAIAVGQSYVCSAAPSEGDNAGYYTQFALLFFLPLVIIIFCYGMILHTLVSTSARQRHRTVLVVLCIVMAFFICWGPYHVLIIVMSVLNHAGCAEQNQLHQAFVVCRILAYSHCCVNPLLYMIRKRSTMILSSIVFCSPELSHAGQERRAIDFSHSNVIQHSELQRIDGCRAKEQNITELKSL